MLYFAIVAVALALSETGTNFNFDLLGSRLLFALLFAVLILLKPRVSVRVFTLVSVISVYAALSVLYKETAALNLFFGTPLDERLMTWDERIFGYQPALKFSERLNGAFFSELMFMGYFSYYLMPLAVLWGISKLPAQKMEEFGFVLISSFLVYYLFFILMPAHGPQFYFEPPANQIEAQGIFGKIIKVIQANGEAPTAAFPSSHVGISWLVLLWLYYNRRSFISVLMPFVILLMMATVYIKAHYFVDVVAGVATAPLVYIASLSLYKLLKWQLKFGK